MFEFLDFEGSLGIDNDDDGILGTSMDDNQAITYSIDTDGDGISDTGYFDTDNDGIYDTSIHLVGIDTDGDGYIDTVSEGADVGMNGSVDAVQIYSDTDGDMLIDTYGEAFSLDTDNDGVLDSLQFNVDQNMDGVFDVSGVVDEAGNVSFLDSVVDAQEEMPYDDAALNEMACYNAAQSEHFNPDDVNAEDVVGDPGEAMEVYHVQETGTSCAVAAQEFVLDQLTDHDYSESELRDLAEKNNWYDPDGGTSIDDMGNILESQGLSVEVDGGNTIDDISNCLENGGAVITGVDVYELYGIEHDYGPDMGANHAVQVTGIDYSDRDQPMIILNDSSNPDGCGVMVPLEDFMDAWEDSGCYMVEAYAN